MKKIILSFAIIFAIGFNPLWAQTQLIKGTVKAESDGVPLPGVTVLIKGTTMGTVTDTDGKYSLNVPKESKTLVFSFIGMKTQEVPIANSVINVAMQSDAQIVDEVVVVAYGTTTREAVTGAVSQVSMDKIESRPVSSVAGALEGSTPGVQVNNSYGEPGANPSIRIRGFASINGSNSPLYVVDGVPYTGNISDINPSDVESMSVLKDAASAALYGNRAANGVVLITTKRGKQGKTRVNASINMGAYTRAIDEFERLGANEWMETSWLGFKNSLVSGDTKYTEAEAIAFAKENFIKDIAQKNIYNKADDALFDDNGKLVDGASVLPGYTDLDWRDGVERTGKRQEYTVGITSAGDKYNVYSSLAYLDEQGYIIASDFERITGRLNASFTPIDWLETGTNINISTTKQNFQGSAGGSSYANPFYKTRTMAPIYPYYAHNDDGSIMLDENEKKQYDFSSPYLDNRHLIYELENNLEYKTRDILKAQAYATISFLKDFKFTIRGDRGIRNETRKSFDNPVIGDGQGANGRLSKNYYRWDEYTFQQQLTWRKTINELHNLDILLGHENYSYNREYNSTAKSNMSIPGIIENNNFTNQINSLGYSSEYYLESFLGRIRYNYDGKYYVDASLRRDGSSRFHPNNRWGNFFSIGANWNITQESFMENIAWVDYAKLRASYGEVGNDAGVNYYGYQALYDIDQNGGAGAFYRKNLGNPDIRWETTSSIDFALETRVYGRVNFSANYFDKRSKDLLFDVALPPSVGVVGSGVSSAEVTKNIGSISNRGVELALDVDVIKSKNWNWNLGADATFLKNKIISLPNGNSITSGTKRLEEGRNIYEFWTYQFVGVDQMDGQSLYKIDTDLYYASGQKPVNDEATEIDAKFAREINGEFYTTNTSYGLRYFSGSAIPDVYGSITSALKWKGLSLDMLFTYSLGGKLYDSSYRSLMSVGTSQRAIHKDIKNSWSGVPEGMTETSANRIDPDGVPVVDSYLSQFSNSMSNRWLLDASYFTIKNITLSYELPKHIISPFRLDRVKIKGSVENLAIFTSKQGINPQYSFKGTSDYTFTSPRVFTFGVDIGL